MDYSPQQIDALTLLSEWVRAPLASRDEQVKLLAGFAGAGKTTILKELAAQSGGQILFAAYTGKAAYVMRSKGCVGATTVHSLIYRPAGESESDALRDLDIEIKVTELREPVDEIKLRRLKGQRDGLLMSEKRRPMFSINEDSPLRHARALFLDECSMVDEEIAHDLESFGVKILACGDPAQLPPVGSGGHYTNRKPNVMLTEVHRQAAESGVLRLATDVRTTGTFNRSPGHYGADCRIINKNGLPPQELADVVLGADQVLVGMNKTRHAYNARYRQLTERLDVLPMAGDKVVCLRNNHDAGLLNGSLWRVHEAVGDTDQMSVEMVVSSEEDGGNGIPITTHAHHFMGREDELKKMSWTRRDREEFDYGYALTVHKSQGSQWDEVCMFDESWAFRQDARRWLYTGATRAAKLLTVVV